MPKKILFLYTELADYTLSCFRALSNTKDAEVFVVHWPPNPEAPFEFTYPEGVKFFSKERCADINWETFIRKLRPSIIVCSGWVDQDYVSLCRKVPHIPRVLALDTCWTGSLKQRIFSWCSKVYLQRVFSHVWIPGLPQQSYAERLGFHDNQILQNLYSADVERFQIFFDEFREEKRAVFPKRFLYVGRYAKEKGLQTLCDAFYRFSKQNVEWELHCLGTGPLTSKGFEHSRIRHFGFVQPSELKAHFQASGIYVMPSHFEPWGVSLHEAVAAGMPAIVSDRVGSASAFVESGKNGYLYPSRDEAELERCLHRMAELDHGELERMSVRSNELAQKITPTDWANELLVLIA